MPPLKAIEPDVLRRYVAEDAIDRLQSYFGSGRFTGGCFERFDGGGDREDVADRFTSADIVAVSMLSVRIPGRASLQLLDQRNDEFNELLAEVPRNVDLWDADRSMIDESSPASALWQAVQDLPGSGWVTAGKLVARKRPRLLPVYDRVVRDALGRKPGEGWWVPLQDALKTNSDIVESLRSLRSGLASGTTYRSCASSTSPSGWRTRACPSPPERRDLSHIEPRLPSLSA